MSVQHSTQYSETIPLVDRGLSTAENIQLASTQPVRRKPIPSGNSLPADLPRLPPSGPQRYSQLQAQDDLNHRTNSSVHEHEEPAAIWDDDDVGHTNPRQWVPYALRLPTLLTLLGFNVLLLITVIVLHVKSARNSGLGIDDGSDRVLFEWRFAPTLLAVVYVFLWMVVVDSVNRTESFARMSRYTGSTAENSLLRATGPWWSALADSLPQRKSGRVASVVLFCAVLAYVLGFLVISPLSSSLLSPKDTLITQRVDFLQPLLDAQASIQPVLRPLTYFRTIGNVLQNVTTSPWISNQYAVIPFWPDHDQYLFTSIPQNSETWRTSGLILEADLQCETMEVAGPRNVTWVTSFYDTNGTFESQLNFTLETVQLTSKSGCEYGFAVAVESINNNEFSYWSNVSNPDLPLGWQALVNLSDPLSTVNDPSDGILFNVTEACTSKQVIISGAAQATDLQVEGRLCSSTYLVGTASIEISTNNNLTSFTFNQQEYESTRHVIHDTMANVTGFQASFLSDTWTNHLQQLSLFSIDSPGAVTSLLPEWGPATMIGALHDFNVSATMEDPNVGGQASTILKRAFGEAILDSISTIQTMSTGSGEVITSERRVVVVEPVAYIVEIVLGIHLLLGGIVLIRNVRGHRHLGVARDVAFTNTIASVVTSDADTQATIEKLYHEDPSVLIKSLGSTTTKMAAGKLRLVSDIDQDSASEHQAKPSQSISGLTNDPITGPFVLRNWLVICLGSLLTLVLILIIILYWYSIDHGLYQSFFIRRTTIDIGSLQVGTLAPYSIIPTFIAVTIGLWWGALEGYFRRMQPYVTQAKGPTPAFKGSGVSYQSSYLLWAAFRASHRRQGLLALMCTGAFFTQILTIAMSALWQTQPSHIRSIHEVNQSLEIRQIPFINYDVNNYKALVQGSVLTQLFSNLQTNWMYSATIQLTLNGSQPAWSKDGWSFVPLDFGSLPNDPSKETPGTSLDGTSADSNATVQTPAIRARLECSPWPYEEHPWWLQQTDDITNASLWKEVTDPSQFSTGYTFDGSFPLLPGGGVLQCCADGTMENPGLSRLGYWVLDHGDASWADKNFSVKWFEGTAQIFELIVPETLTDYRFTWLEKPSVVAANCTPVIESANARVMLDIETQRVHNYEILDDVTTEANAWTDSFVQHMDNDTAILANVTTSYGWLYLQALLKAAQLNLLNQACQNYSYGCVEDLTDETFNFRESASNMDFMTYSMLTMANNSNANISDSSEWISLAQTTFTTFFQHFASSNLTVNGERGWVYQRINATMPDLNGTSFIGKRSETSTAPVIQVTITVDKPVEILHMSAVAVGLSLFILVWLLVTTILILVVKKRYFSPLLRNINTVADLAILVAGSDRYLALAKERGMEGLQDRKDFQTRLGWFRRVNGEVRWGIELVDEHVEWLTEKEVDALRKASDSDGHTELAGDAAGDGEEHEEHEAHAAQEAPQA